jgi:EAL domain-containing protein (putative c-di-GMP-specific phosphodiesterase class I)
LRAGGEDPLFSLKSNPSMTSGKPMERALLNPDCSGTIEAAPSGSPPTIDPPGIWIDRLTEGNGLSVVFQPIVNLLTGELLGHEVLGRFAIDTREAIHYGAKDPPTLLNLAYTHGRLLALDRGFRRLGIEAAARQPTGARGLFFLNVDPRVIENPTFATGYTRGLIDHLGLSPARFVLELTEAVAALDTAQIARFVDHYANQGFRIALDDVGAGYASLTALIRLRPHFLKLDKELVSGLADDPLRVSLVRSLADFGRRSSLLVIAEGIETERDLVALIRAGVPFGQGYLLGRPAREPLPPLSPALDIVSETASSIDRTEHRKARATRVSVLLVDTPAVSPKLRCADADRLLRQQRGRRGLPVVEADGTIAGLVTRDRLNGAALDHSGAGLDGEFPVAEVMDTHPLSVDESASLEYVCRLATTRDDSQLDDPVLIERDGRYAGVVPVHALLSAMTALELEHARDAALSVPPASASPRTLTGMPDSRT